MSAVLNSVAFAARAGWLAASVPGQNEAKSWGDSDYAQVSCYTARDRAFSKDGIFQFEYRLNTEFKKSGDSESALWTDCYYGKGSLTVTSGNDEITGTAYGVGNDFFAFHPLKLLSGAYLDSDSTNTDYIILDEEAAWRLFGSYNVAGLTVSIGETIYTVYGVVQQPDDRYTRAAGSDSYTFYVMYDTLAKYDENTAITGYEVMALNPVKHYVYNYVKEYYKDEAVMDIVENTDRYSFANSWKQLKTMVYRSVDSNEIQYPYWENVAKIYENIIAFYTFVRIILLFTATVAFAGTTVCTIKLIMTK